MPMEAGNAAASAIMIRPGTAPARNKAPTDPPEIIEYINECADLSFKYLAEQEKVRMPLQEEILTALRGGKAKKKSWFPFK